MKGDATVIKHLNTILANEMIAINQYFLHARMFKHWGFIKLGDKEYEESVDEMKHADVLIERILFLDGKPNLEVGKLAIGKDTKQIFGNDLKLEVKARADLQVAISYCEKVQDFVSRDILRTILTNEEEHIDWLETQLDLIETVSLENYLQTNM